MAHSASFRRGRFRFAGSLLLGLASSTALLLTGCDSESNKTDKKVTEQLNAAMDEMTGSANDRQKANSELDTAAKETTATLPVQLGAKTVLADSELQIAQGLVQQIQGNDFLIDRLSREIGLIGNEIQTNNQMVSVLSKREPTAVQAAVVANSAGVKGSEEKQEWYKSDSNSLPSLAGIDKQVAGLQADVSKLQETIKSESDQRNQLLDQADKLSQQSLHEQKDKSVDLYLKGSDARKQAADLTVKLDLDNTDLTKAQADLALHQAQHDSLTAALKNLDDKSSLIADDWKNAQQQMTGLNNASKTLLGEDPVTPPALDAKGDLKTDPTISSKAAAIFELARKNHELRTNADTHFNNAVGVYKDAIELADKIEKELSDRKNKVTEQKPEWAAWTGELNAFEPSTYRYLQADAQLQKAEFSAHNAAQAKARLDLETQIKTVLQSAQLTPPPTLDDSDGTLATELKNAQASAVESFKDGTDILAQIFDGTGSQDQRNAAKIHEIFGQYGWSLLAASSGDSQEAASHLAFARNAVQSAITAGASLPQVPSTLLAPVPAGKTPGRARG